MNYKNINHIYLDMDGVLANFVQACIDLLGHTSTSRITHDQITSWDLGSRLGLPMNELWRRIDQQGHLFWQHLRAYPWAGDLALLCATSAPRCSILTSTSARPHAVAGKAPWLEGRLYGNIPATYVTNAKHKAMFARGPGDVLIDDSNENCEDWARCGGTAICFPQPWNRQGHIITPADKMAYVIDQLSNVRI